MMLLFEVFVQLIVEPLIAHVVCNSQQLEQLRVCFYLNTGHIQLDCFDRSVYSQCALCNKTWLKFRNTFSLFY